MRDLVIAALLSGGALFVSQSLPKEQEQEPTPVVETFEEKVVCDCCVNGEPCTCDPCLCENCPCKEKSVLEKPEVVVEKFDSSFIEADISDLKARVGLMERDLTSLNSSVKELKSKPHLSEEDVRKIVKEEIEVTLKIQTKEGKVEEKVTKIENTGSEIVIPPGGKLLSINGVPVEQRNVYSPTPVVQYYTEDYYYNVPNYSYSSPVVGTMGSNCVNGSCGTSYQMYNSSPSYYGGFSSCGPGGCN